MDKLIVLGLALVVIGLADAHWPPAGGHHHRHHHRHHGGPYQGGPPSHGGPLHGGFPHHGASHHRSAYMNHLITHMMKVNPMHAKIALSQVRCALTRSSFQADGSEQQRTLWPSFFANVKSKEACAMLCYGKPWSCGAYVVASGMGGPTPCILFMRSRANEMGATADLPEEMKNNATYYEMKCKGKYMNNEMLFKIGRQMLMRRMPMLMNKVDPLINGIKERLGLADPKRRDIGTNPFAKPRTGQPETNRYPVPEPSPSPETYHHQHHHRRFHHQQPNGYGPPPPPGGRSLNGNDAGKAKVGHPEQMKEDAPVAVEGGSDPNDHPTFKRKLEPGEVVEQGHLDAPEKPKVGPNGEPAGWKPGQAEVGQGWKRKQEVDPEIAAAEQAERRRRRKHHHKKELDPDAF